MRDYHIFIWIVLDFDVFLLLLERLAQLEGDLVAYEDERDYHEVDDVGDGVVDEGGDDGGAQAEAALEAASDVVLAAPFPDPEAACGRDPGVARVQAAPSMEYQTSFQ